MKRAKGTEYSVRRNPSGATPVHRSANARVRHRDSDAPLTGRALDYEGRIADLQQKIHELEESRSVLAARLRLSEDIKENVEGIHHSWVTMFDSLADPIFLHDAQGRVVRANRAYAEAAKMDIRDVLGKYYWGVFPRREGPTPSCRLSPASSDEHGEEELILETGQTYLCRQFSLRGNHGAYLYSLHIMQDITERKGAETALQQERNFISAVLDTSGGLVVVLDREGRIVRFNHACETTTGFSQSEMLGRYVWDVLRPEDTDDVKAVFSSLLARQFPNQHQNYWRAKDGDQRLIMWSNTVLHDDRGEVEFVIGTGIDITERKIAEDALRDSEACFRALIENSSDITTLLDRDGIARYTSPSIGRVLGYGENELVGQNILTLVHPDDLPQVQGALARVLENPGLAEHVEHRFRDKNGVWRYLDSIGKYQSNDSPMAGVVVNSRDVTVRKLAEEKVRKSEERFRNLVETTSDWVWEVDENAKYTYASPRVRDLLGYDPEKLIGKSPFDLMPPEEAQRVADVFALIAAKHQTFTGLKNTNLHKDGRLVVLETSGVPYFDKNGIFRGYRGIDRDITERKRAEESLHRLNRSLRTLSACNESLVHAMDEQELLAAICEVIVNTGGYRFAWVGYAQHDETKSVRAMAYAGHEAGYLQTHITSWSDGEHGQGPIGTAIRSGTPNVIRNLREDPRFLPWREEALRRGYASCIALPLRAGETALGGLSIYASEPDAFNDEEAKLLMELADDLTYGIVALRTRAESERVMEENRQNAARLEQVLIKTIESIGSALEKRDPYTAGHQHQVAKLAHAIAQEMKLPQQVVEGIYMGGLIHDIGKIYVPAEILSRPGRLSEAEFNLIKAHPQVGYDIVKGIEFPWPITQMILQHHERLDGSGYPQGLKDGEIAMEAKILAVADVVEAMASHRPYRPGLGLDKALNEIGKNRGILYDPSAVDACLRLFQEKGFKFE